MGELREICVTPTEHLVLVCIGKSEWLKEGDMRGHGVVRAVE